MNTRNLNEFFGTLSETIDGLIKLGYTHDFNIKNGHMAGHRTSSVLSPDDFNIDKVYRLEGTSDSDYQSILYAISSKKNELKGTLVNGYGTSSDEASSKLVEKLQINQLDGT